MLLARLIVLPLEPAVRIYLYPVHHQEMAVRLVFRSVHWLIGRCQDADPQGCQPGLGSSLIMLSRVVVVPTKIDRH